jgi:hypothetical protein
MGNREINPAVMIAVIVVVLCVVGYFGYRATSPPTPAPGSYTPGVPPWMDKNNKSAQSTGVHDPSQAAPLGTAPSGAH